MANDDSSPKPPVRAVPRPGATRAKPPTSTTPRAPIAAATPRAPMATIDVDPSWLIDGIPESFTPKSSARAPLSTIVVEDGWLDEETTTSVKVVR